MYNRLTLNLESAKKRYEMLEGRQHVVVPAAIMAEGVWEGSGGKILYRNEELQKWISGWNHKPLVVYHPTNNNQPISAADPAVLNSRKVGITLGAKHDDKSWAECWFDVERTRSIDNRILTKIENSEPIEVSTGLEMDLKPEGEWNGTKYVGEGVNHRPDHLAILPDKIGAYSVKSGGGIFANAKGLNQLPESLQSVLLRSLQNGAKILTNELSFSEISCQLCELLAAKYGEPGKYWQGYIYDVYETYLIYRDQDKLWMIGYKMENDVVSLDGDAQEVQRVTEYEVVNGGPTYVGNQGQLTLKERETEMAGTFDRKAHLNSLIGNGYAEADRAVLEKMDDAALSIIKPVKVVNAAPTPEPAKPKKFFVQNADGSFSEAALQPTQQAKQPTLAELVQSSGDPAVVAEFSRIQRRFQAEKDALVANILTNPNNRFTKEWLEAQTDIDLLSGIAAAGTTTQQQVQNGQPQMLQPVFFGNAGGYQTQNAAIPTETLVPVDMQFESVIK